MKREVLLLACACVVATVFIVRHGVGDETATPVGAVKSLSEPQVTPSQALPAAAAPVPGHEEQTSPLQQIHYPQSAPLTEAARADADAARAAAGRSLADFLSAGDPRSPPLARGGTDVLPTPDELDGGANYARYEARQNVQLVQRYAVAAQAALAQWRVDFARAVASGASAEQLREAEDKMQHLQAVLDRIDPETGTLAPVP